MSHRLSNCLIALAALPSIAMVPPAYAGTAEGPSDHANMQAGGDAHPASSPAVSPEEISNQGNSLLDAGKYGEAVQCFRLAAEQGVIDAQYNMGVCYYHGLGVEQNTTEAVKWYRLAAQQGDAEAQCFLG